MGHTPGNTVYELYEELGISDGKLLGLDTYMRFYDQASGKVLDVNGDLENLEMNLFTQFIQDDKLILPALIFETTEIGLGVNFI